MKSKIFLGLIFSLCFLFSGCSVGKVASTQGLSDQAYLVFISNTKYNKPVQVALDGSTTFNAKVFKDGKWNIKGDTYSVATGTRSIVVTSNGKTLYDRNIFLSTQETKEILLP